MTRVELGTRGLGQELTRAACCLGLGGMKGGSPVRLCGGGAQPCGEDGGRCPGRPGWESGTVRCRGICVGLVAPPHHRQVTGASNSGQRGQLSRARDAQGTSQPLWGEVALTQGRWPPGPCQVRGSGRSASGVRRCTVGPSWFWKVLPHCLSLPICKMGVA